MLEEPSVRRVVAAVVLCAALLAGPAQGQDNPKKGGAVPIIFVPPPIDNATYSVGVYDVKTSKLVRRLCEAAGQNMFKVGLNGLVTSWDGKDDDGKPLPPGKYAARGYAVGPLEVEGVAIHGNDWIGDDDALRVRTVGAIALVPEDDGLAAVVVGADGHKMLLRSSGKDGALLWKKAIPDYHEEGFGGTSPHLRVEDGVIYATRGAGYHQYRVSDGADVVPTKRLSEPLIESTGHVSKGKDGTIWMATGSELYQFQAGALPDDKVPATLDLSDDLLAKVIRRLPEHTGEPTPYEVSASHTQDKIYISEAVGAWFRVRGLSWVATAEENGKPVSTWKTFFERDIRLNDPALGLQDALRANASVPPVEIALEENPLAPGKHEQSKLIATYDEKGSYLSTVEGLRLRQISQREHLMVVRLTENKTPKKLTFLQTDLAAWDEFSISGFDKIATFDAGEFEIDAAGEKPIAEKVAEPDL